MPCGEPKCGTVRPQYHQETQTSSAIRVIQHCSLALALHKQLFNGEMPVLTSLEDPSPNALIIKMRTIKMPLD